MGFMTNLIPYGKSERGLVQHTVGELQRATDILIHVNEALDDTQRKKAVTALQRMEGVASAESTPQRWHLPTVWYDANCTSSHAIIDKLQLQNLHVQLIGPI